MKAFLVAVGLVGALTTAASAQYAPYSKSAHPYAQRHHSVCQEKAFRLHGYERRAASDGRLSYRERQTIRDLQRDLDRTCGRYRHRG